MNDLSFQALDPDYQARIHNTFEQQAVMRFLGAELHSVSPGRCEIHLPYRQELTQQNGYFHAGITSTIADSAAGCAGYTLMPADTDVLSVEFKINLLRPAQGERLIARGRVIKPGRTLVIAQSDVYGLQSGEEVHCAVLSVTLMTMHNKKN